jgi:hypothetical protein
VWRLELFCIRDGARGTTERELVHNANIVNLKPKILF